MTQKEKIIATAYTGISFVDNFTDIQTYAEEVLRRPVYTHEMAEKSFWGTLKDACRKDFLEMISKTTREI